jgi:hypothetical protein
VQKQSGGMEVYMKSIKNFLTILLVMAILFVSQITVCSATEYTANTLYIQIGDRTLTATLIDNSSAQALKELLAGNPMTIYI